MLRIITGDAGSGKSTRIHTLISEAVAAGKRSYLIVPEQETVWRERLLTSCLPESYPLFFEVTNFSRLADTVFRSLGGLAYDRATSGTRAVIMWHTLCELLPLLNGMSGKVEYGRVKKMLSATSELSAEGISPEMLDVAAKKLPEGSGLRDELNDLSLIAASFAAFFADKYDDGGDELTRLAKLLRGSDFFAGCEIYIDGFTSFTTPERDVLSSLISSCDVTVALTIPEDRRCDDCFAEICDTEARLIACASDKGCEILREDMGECKRQKSPMLSHASKSLWGIEKAPEFTGDADASLRVIDAMDAYDEAEFVACDIERAVAHGARYRDFAVLAADIEQYRGIIDAILEKHGIPYFISSADDIATFRPIKLIYTAYAAVCGGFRRQDVISYMKCGLFDIPDDEADEFECYVEKWNIRGKLFTLDEDWNMNPAGYREQLDEAGIGTLERVNSVRRTLLAPLIAFGEDCRGKHTVREHSSILFDFLSSLRLEEKLAECAAAARARGDAREAEADEKLFGIIISSLDKLVSVLPDMELSAEDYLALLKIMFGEADISSIPTSCDEVTLGSASMLRANEPKHVYLLGVSDGVFPSPGATSGFFSDSERETLSRLGIELGQNADICAAKELFCFYRALRCASECVTLLTPRLGSDMKSTRRSSVVTRLCDMFSGNIVTRTSDIPARDRIWRVCDIPDGLSGKNDDALLSEVKLALDGDGDALRKIETLYLPVSDWDCRVAPEVAAGDSRVLSLTQSRIDAYVRCPFSYFCRYVLKLDEDKKCEFDFSDMGNFTHAVLEKMFALVEKRGLDFPTLTNEELRELTRSVTEDYISFLLNDERSRSPRLMHLFERLSSSVQIVAEYMRDEFAQSDFTPEFFELGVGLGEDSAKPVTFTLPDGCEVILRGKIDRADVFRKDGKTYLRVVDYKSSKHLFKLDDVQRGLGLQLLIYLMSLTKSGDKKISSRIGDEIIPAGAMYMTVNPTVKRDSLPPGASEEEIREEAKRSLSKSGVFLSDENVLRAMEHDLSGKYIPITLTKSGDYSAASRRSLSSLEELGRLMLEVGETVCRIGESIRSGRADATPLRYGGNSSCKNCGMKQICRSVKL